MGQEDALKTFFKYAITNTGGLPSGSTFLWEDLSFEARPGKETAVVLKASPSAREAYPFFGNPAGDYYFVGGEDGRVGGNPFGDEAGILVWGKPGEGSVWSWEDAVDEGPNHIGSRGGTGGLTWQGALERGETAYTPGHETMLQNLMSIPAVNRMINRLSPIEGRRGEKYLDTVRKVWNAHVEKYGVARSGSKHTTAFDTWPKLMTFLEAANAAFNELEEKKGVPNPMHELFLSHNGLEEVLTDAALGWKKKGYNRIVTPRLQGETDEQFYQRQLDAINAHRKEKGALPLDFDSYYNWVIDRLVRNLYSAAQALKGREKEIKEVGELRSQLNVYVTSANRKLGALKKEKDRYLDSIRNELPSYTGWRRRVEWLAERIGKVDAAIEKSGAPEGFKPYGGTGAGGNGGAGKGELESLVKEMKELEKRLAKMEESCVSKILERLLESRGETRTSAPPDMLEQLKELARDMVKDQKANGKGRLWTDEYADVYDALSDTRSRIKDLDLDDGDGVSVSAEIKPSNRMQSWLLDYRGKKIAQLSEAKEKLEPLEKAFKLYKGLEDEHSKMLNEKNSYMEAINIAIHRLVPDVQLFQMAVPESDIISWSNDDFSSVPLSNASMRMVSAGVLLGDSGMGLDDVKRNCKRYFDLRSKGCPGAEAFEQLFGVDPLNVPSDERIKDFHRSYRRAKDGEEQRRRIVDAVCMEVF